MSLEKAFQVSASGLTAQRTRMETVAANLANAKVTRTAEGGPYRRRYPVFVAEPQPFAFGDELGRALRSVRVERIVEDSSPPLLRHEPGHPDADERGFVAYPNVDPVREMVDMLSATRSYEANVTAIGSIRSMLQSALEIIR